MQIKDKTGRIVAHIESMECKHHRDDVWVFTARTDGKVALDEDDTRAIFRGLKGAAKRLMAHAQQQEHVLGISELVSLAGYTNYRKKGLIRGELDLFFNWTGSKAAAKRFGDELAASAHKG